jgi:polysaccharide pyruvyl transferase WcaK-like protein
LGFYELIAPRDSNSLEFLANLGVKNFVSGTDSAFAIDDRITHIGRENVTVGVSVRAFQEHYGHKDLYDSYLLEFAKIVQHVCDRGFRLVWILTDDRPGFGKLSDAVVAKEILAIAGNKYRALCKVPESAIEVEEMLDAFGEVDVLISTRLHPVIIGALCGVPAIGVSYDRKCDYFFELLEMKQDLFALAGFAAANVNARLDEIIEQKNERSIRLRLAVDRQKKHLGSIIDLLSANVSCGSLE